jgi:hypothetical protein
MTVVNVLPSVCHYIASECKTNEQDGVAVTIEIPVCEVLSSNPGQDSDYPHILLLQGNAGIVLSIRP